MYPGQRLLGSHRIVQPGWNGNARPEDTLGTSQPTSKGNVRYVTDLGICRKHAIATLSVADGRFEESIMSVLIQSMSFKDMS
jgi:hypothetical protein